jgi:hypothetical protein
MDSEGEIILYQPDNTIKLNVRVDSETIWLTQKQISDLFGVKQPAVSRHLKNIFNCGELEEISVHSILEYTAKDGKVYQTGFYNLDAILSVGYRVNSINATKFRQWANKVLKDYLLKGYSISNRIDNLEKKVDKHLAQHDARIDDITNKVDFFIRTSLPPKEGIFYDGQVYDAFDFIEKLIKSAQSHITLIDNYIDESVFTMFSRKAAGTQVKIYSKNFSNIVQLAAEKFNAQYGNLELIEYHKSHDRFLFIDNSVYHIGASLKDLGKKLFAFSKMELSPEEIIRL